MYCDNCNNEVTPVYMPGSKIIPVKGVGINVNYKSPFCPICGSEIYDDSVDAFIYKSARHSYKRRMRLMQSDEIRKFIIKSGMDPKALAEKLDCSVSELLSAANDGVQTKELDKKIRTEMKNLA